MQCKQKWATLRDIREFCGNAWIVATCFEDAHIKLEDKYKEARPANFARDAGECEKLVIHGAAAILQNFALSSKKIKINF